MCGKWNGNAARTGANVENQRPRLVAGGRQKSIDRFVGQECAVPAIVHRRIPRKVNAFRQWKV